MSALGIRFKLFLALVGLIALAIVTAEFYLSGVLETRLTERIRSELLVRSQLVAERVTAEPAADLRDERTYDALADRLGAASGARVTLVRKDGTVAGDSEVELKELSKLENHATRPEIEAALNRGEGDSVRFSTTLHESMMYVAVPIAQGGNVIGAARVAMPLTQVDVALGELRRTVMVAALFGLLVAAIGSYTAANMLSRRLREITETARRMAAGNLAVRTRATGHDETAALGRALDGLAESLSSSLEQMRGERDLLSGILSSMHEGVLVVGPDRRIVMTNPALRDMLLAGADAVGKPVLHVIRNAELNELLEGAGGAGPSQEAFEAELELGGIKARRVLARAVTLHEGPGGVVAVFVDVTELRRLESVRRDFVANASHELRSPLTTIRAAVETLHAVKDDPTEATRFIELIERNTERIENLVSDLLELARLESRELDLHMESVELDAAVERILARHTGRAELKRISLLNDIPSATMARADSRALDHLVGNLVDNALKYCPTGSTIRLGARVEGERVRVTVADDGPGIPPEHLERLFERFYRVDAGRSRELGGTGLGLSIVKHLAEAMGGNASVESRVGAGTTFAFTLQRPGGAAASSATPTTTVGIL